MKHRRVVEDDGLEILDPTTGDALVEESSRRPPPDASRRRLARWRVVFVVLAFTSAGLAAYTGWSVATLRRIERTWRTAIAVDVVRERTDAEIFDVLGTYDNLDENADFYLVSVGSAAASEYAKAEGTLRTVNSIDRRTRALRDTMVEALEFRQLQMSAQRRQLGGTPLTKADALLRKELRRWRLGPRAVEAARIPAAADALARIRRFADEATSTTLVALAQNGESLVTVDIDGSTIARRTLPAVATRLLALAPDVVVAVGPSGASAYRRGSPSSAGPIWERAGATAFAVAGDDKLWVRQGNDVFRYRSRETPIDGTFTLPAGTEPVEALGDGLVLQSTSVPENHDVELWMPETGQRTKLATGVRRVIGAGRSVVVVERRRTLEEARTTVGFGDVVEVISDRGRAVQMIGLTVPLGFAVQRPGGIEIAASGGPLAGNIATVFRFMLPGFLAPNGPRASIEPGTIAWSLDGDFLFWARPDEGVAVHQPARRRQQTLRADIGPVRSIVAFGTQR